MTQVRTQVLDLITLVAMWLLLAWAAFYWFRLGNYKRSTQLMKVQYFTGLLLLI
jgi:hypothetical protein